MAITDRRDARVERTVAKVLDAVHRLLRTEGLGSVTFGRVSKETGVSRTTLYRHWSSPSELISEAWARVAPSNRVPHTDDLADDLVGLFVGQLTLSGVMWRWSREVGGDAGSVEEGHGDEGFGLVEAAGVGAEPADRGVVGLGDPVGEPPLDGGFDRGPVAADRACEADEGVEIPWPSAATTDENRVGSG